MPTPCSAARRRKASALARRRPRTAISTSRAARRMRNQTGADAVHPGYGFLSENARFAEILADHNLHFIGPKDRTYPPDGRQDRGQKTANGSAFPWCPAPTARSAANDDALAIAEKIGFPVLVKGRRRRRRTRHEGSRKPPRPDTRAIDGRQRSQIRFPAMRPSTSRNICRSRAISKSKCSATVARRHPSWRARLLAATAASEGLGGRSLACARCRRARQDRRRPWRRPCRR